MSEEQNKAIVRSSTEASWKKQDWAEAAKYIAADHIAHGPMTDQLPGGPEGNKTFISAMIAAFPDVQYTIDKQEAEGDIVRTWMTFVGTNTGSLMGQPPTGKSITVTVFSTSRIANGQIVESWNEWDDQDMLRQLGLA